MGVIIVTINCVADRLSANLQCNKCDSVAESVLYPTESRHRDYSSFTAL